MSSSGQDDEAVTEARKYAVRTEEFISQRRAEIYGPGAQLGFEDDCVTTFVDAFVEGGRYPLERIVEVTLRAIDVRLQQEYIAFDGGSMNVILYGDHAEDEAYQAQARVRLARMALQQSLIGRSRILWEKIFRWIYFIENGQDIEGHSVKKRFFVWASVTPCWRFLEVYEALVGKFDQTYRTAEYHKHSVVRAHMLHGTTIDDNELLKMVNAANPIPRNVVQIMREGWTNHFTDLHFIDGDYKRGINKRYLHPTHDN